MHRPIQPFHSLPVAALHPGHLQSRRPDRKCHKLCHHSSSRNYFLLDNVHEQYGPQALVTGAAQWSNFPHWNR